MPYYFRSGISLFKPLTVWVEVILHAILFSLRNQPEQTSHCMDGGNIACHIIFVAESACSNLSLYGWR